MHESLFMENLRKKVVEAVGRRMNRSEAAHLFGISLSSVKGVTLVWSLPLSTHGEDNRRVQMTKIVLLHRTDLSPSVVTCPWHVRANSLPKLP